MNSIAVVNKTGIKVGKPTAVGTAKRKLSSENSEEHGTPLVSKPKLSKPVSSQSASSLSDASLQLSPQPSAEILPKVLPSTSKQFIPVEPPTNQAQELMKEILKGFDLRFNEMSTHLDSRFDIIENKVDGIQAETKRMTYILVAGQARLDNTELKIEDEDEFLKDIKSSFPIDNEETLQRFNEAFSDPKNVSQFVQHMSDVSIKDSNIADGKKLVRFFIDNFFTRRFLLNANRTGVRRSKGPPKVRLESYENVLMTFHRCIQVGSPYFGYSGTKQALWKLCDTAMQRCKDKSTENDNSLCDVDYENYELIYGENDDQQIRDKDSVDEANMN